MKRTTQQEKAFLLAIAKAIASRLKVESSGTRLRIRNPLLAGELFHYLGEAHEGHTKGRDP